MNAKQLGFIRTALLIAIWSYVFDSPLERSVYGWIGTIAIILAAIVVNIDSLTKIGEAACQVLVDIGEAIASFAIAIYKFVLSPLIGRWLGSGK